MTLAKLGEFLEQNARLADQTKAAKGFQARALLQSLSYPQRFSALSYWRCREDYMTWATAPARRAFDQINPNNGLFTAVAPQDAYEDVHEVCGAGEWGDAMVVEWTVNPGPANTEAFEKSRKEHFELQKKEAQGFVEHKFYRAAGNPLRYLVVNRWTSREAQRAAARMPLVEEFNRAHPTTDYGVATPIAGEGYQVVRQW